MLSGSVAQLAYSITVRAVPQSFTMTLNIPPPCFLPFTLRKRLRDGLDLCSRGASRFTFAIIMN